MANVYTPSQLISKVVGSFGYVESVYFKLANGNIPEFVAAASGKFSYAPGDTVSIPLPYYLSAQLGTSISDDSIDETTIGYKIGQNDVYSTQYPIDVVEGIINVVGGQAVFTKDPFVIVDGQTEMKAEFKNYFNRYRYQQGIAIAVGIDNALAEKARKAFWYTPIDRPSKLKEINSFADLSSVFTLATKLNLTMSGNLIMNPDDAAGFKNSQQNSFNSSFNTTISAKFQVGQASSWDIFQSSLTSVTDTSPEYTLQIATVSQPFATVTSLAADGKTLVLSGVAATAGLIFNAGTLLALPDVNLFNRVTRKDVATTLVVCVSADANGDGAGNVTVILSDPLIAAGGQTNVNVLPVNGDPAEIFPGHSNNYAIGDMGLISNCLPLTDILGADNAKYVSKDNKMMTYTAGQGVIQDYINRYRVTSLAPTLAIPRYGINLIGRLKA